MIVSRDGARYSAIRGRKRWTRRDGGCFEQDNAEATGPKGGQQEERKEGRGRQMDGEEGGLR